MALAVMFYFGQVIVFCRSINKNVLEWFLLIISKKCTLMTWMRCTNLSRNHSTLCFWLRRGRQMPNTSLLSNFMIRSKEAAVRILKTFQKYLRTGAFEIWFWNFLIITYYHSELVMKNVFPVHFINSVVIRLKNRRV